MAEISWAEGPRTALLCIDAWERGVPVGRLYTPRFPQGTEFYGLTHFLQEMEATLDTLEDPIEYLHRNQKSIVSQREIAVDTRDYHHALRASLRQAPDVIQLGEMRDLETVRTAMTAAETGHLIFATLHNKGAVNAIDRIIDSFPPDQQNQIRIQLSAVVHTVVSQQLLPDVQGGMVPAFEILRMTGAVRAMIREGMVSMDDAILKLYRAGRITQETALHYCDNPQTLRRKTEP